MHDPLELTLFGSPQVHLHSQPVTGFRSSKAQALLYYLAVTGRPHTRPRLVGLFWGDQPEAAARTSLSKCLSNLRDLFGDAVLVERQTVAFNRNYPYHLDTESFITGAGAQGTTERIQPLQAALALYHGDFLEGFYVRDAPEFEQWLLTQRAYYREAAIRNLYVLATYAEQQGDLPAAIAHIRRLLALEPWREGAHRQLMTLLARSGQRATALAQFETCRRVLEEELAVEPDAETLALVEAIRADDLNKTNNGQDYLVTVPFRLAELAWKPHLVTPPLPIPPTPLIGRESELAELGELIDNPQCRLITITGPGGIGKTRLVLAVAERHLAAQRFRDGACFVALAAVDDAQAILPTLMNALALSPGSSQASAEADKRRLLTFLANKQMLVIFDNFEQVMEGRALLLEILTATTMIQLLVTSRERLHLHNEQLYPLGGLACPATIADKDAPALALFLRTAQRIHPHFQPDPQEWIPLLRICQLVAGMPLALELAASWIHLLTPSAIAQALQTNLDLLEANIYDLPARHRTMRAAFDATWTLLCDQERQLFAQLSVFRGGFTRDAGQQIAGATLKQLSTLADKSLIEYRHTADRYEIHELLRQYGTEKLLAIDLYEGTHERHLLYYLALAELGEPNLGAQRATEIEQMAQRQPYMKLDRHQETAWFERLECNHDNLRAALQWSLTAKITAAAVRLAGALAEFWYMRGYYSEGRSWLERALGQYTDAPSFGQGWALRKAGKLAMAQGHYAQATTLFATSLEVYHKLEGKEGIASSLNFLGVAALHQKDLEQAEQFLEQSLVLRRELNEREDIAATLHNLGLVAMYQHNFFQATVFFNESLAILGNDGDADEGYFYRTSIGYLKLYQEDVTEAGAHFRKTISLALEESNQQTTIFCLEGLAYIASLYGTGKEERRQAVRLLSVADALRINLGTPRPSMYRSLYDKSIAAIRAQISEADFTLAWDEGQKMSPEQAIAYD